VSAFSALLHKEAVAEEICDKLTFSIDGIAMDTWSGEQDWIEVSPVAGGIHTFIWTYNKDKSMSEGEDTAWIDAVVLP